MASLMLDLVFLCDCTGSMASYIMTAQDKIRTIVTQIANSERCDIRFALVCYRDHPPQDRSFVTRVFPFTASVDEMKRNVDWMTAKGGGDGPEAVTDALHQALHLPYRADATKLCVLIANAPPHGIGETSDGFPDGCPAGHDLIKIVREMARNGITLYAVGCEPALSSYMRERFLRSIADITGGQAVPLASSSLLADLIIGGAQEEIALEKLMDDLRIEVENEAPTLTASTYNQEVCKKIASRITKKLQEQGVQAKHLEFDGCLQASHEYYKQAKSLPEAVSNMKAAGFQSSTATTSSSIPSSFMRVKDDVISQKQVRRMIQKSAARRGLC